MKKIFVSAIIIFSCMVCKGQKDSISELSDGSHLLLVDSLVIGTWINTSDTSWSIRFSKDSMLERIYFKKTKSYDVIGYSYSVGYQEQSLAPPGGSPDLKDWQGYYVQAWDDSNPKMESFRDFAIFSLNNGYLRIDKNGESLFKKKILK